MKKFLLKNPDFQGLPGFSAVCWLESQTTKIMAREGDGKKTELLRNLKPKP
jgi:hypothetical protein